MRCSLRCSMLAGGLCLWVSRPLRRAAWWCRLRMLRKYWAIWMNNRFLRRIALLKSRIRRNGAGKAHIWSRKTTIRSKLMIWRRSWGIFLRKRLKAASKKSKRKKKKKRKIIRILLHFLLLQQVITQIKNQKLRIYSLQKCKWFNNKMNSQTKFQIWHHKLKSSSLIKDLI